jgi:hypothetical protein
MDEGSESTELPGRSVFSNGLERDYLHEVLYSLARARIDEGMYDSALKLCHDALHESYAKAEAIVFDCKEAGEQTSSRLLELRKDLAGIWCTYARTILGVVEAVWRPGNQRQHLSAQKAMKSLIALGRLALASATTCPIVGGHGCIPIALKRFSHFLDSSTNPIDESESWSDEGEFDRPGPRFAGVDGLNFVQTIELPLLLKRCCSSGSSEIISLEDGHRQVVLKELEKLKSIDVQKCLFSDRIRKAAASFEQFPSLPSNENLKLDLLTSLHQNGAVRTASLLEQYTAMVRSVNQHIGEVSGLLQTTNERSFNLFDLVCGPGSACFDNQDFDRARGVQESRFLGKRSIEDALRDTKQAREVDIRGKRAESVEQHSRPRQGQLYFDLRFPCQRCQVADFETPAELEQHLLTCTARSATR